MPPIAVAKQVIDRLYDRVHRSVVAIDRYKGNDPAGFGTGFVIVSDQKQVLVSVHESIVKDGERLVVRYFYGFEEEATIFLSNTSSKHVILKLSPIPSCYRHRVTFSQKMVSRQNIFTIAAVEMYGDRGLMSGTVSNPNCKAVRSNGTIVPGSEDLCAISCPVAGPKKRGELKGEDLEILGAAVFDMDGLVIGSVDSVDLRAFHIKYSRKTTSFLNELECLLKNKDNTIVLSRDQQGFTKGAGTSKQGSNTAGSSRKRGGDDLPEGGTRTKKGLYSVHGDMNVGRKEAMRRELVRLVTQGSDDGWLGSLSSPGDLATFSAFAKASASAVSPNFEAGAGTMDSRFGKEHLGDSSIKLR